MIFYQPMRNIPFYPLNVVNVGIWPLKIFSGHFFLEYLKMVRYGDGFPRASKPYIETCFYVKVGSLNTHKIFYKVL